MLRTMAPPVVANVPGYTGSGPAHWQTLWERANPAGFRRVNQENWDDPQLERWVEALDRAVRSSTDALILVGHSLGAVTITLWAERQQTMPGHIRGALLVAPCDTERPDALEVLKSFAPMPRSPLALPAILVGSDDDPFISPVRCAEFAAAWGARLELLRSAGHINTASGHGPFPEGEQFLGELVAGVQR